MTNNKIDIKVENIVVTTSLTDKIEIDKLADILPDAKYDPSQFPGLILNFQDPKTAVLIFSSGKIICTGAKKMEDSINIIQKVIDRVKPIDSSISENPDITVQNMVASMDLKKEILLNTIAQDLIGEHIEYEPEQFPGLVYKIRELGIVALIFSSGKVVLTGAKNPEDIDQARDIVKEKLESIGVI